MEVSPSALEFRGTFTKQSTEYLKLTNTSKSPLAFKVKTTAPKLYCVRPNASIVQPGDSIDISIILQGFSQPLSPDYKCKDKFLLVSLPCPELSDPAKVSDAWAELEARYKPQVVQKKLRVNYIISDHDDESGAGAAAVKSPFNGNGHSEADVSHINQTVINDASTAHATPVKQFSNGAPYGAAGAAAGAAAASSGSSRFNNSYSATNDRSPQYQATTPRAAPPSPPSAPAPPIPQEYNSPPQQQTRYEEKAPVQTHSQHTQVATPEPVQGISIQLAGALIVIAFLTGWLIF